jgi:type VII secretion-associated serine protease mycosin
MAIQLLDTASSNAMGGAAARAAGLTGKGVTVAVVDSGVSAAHPQLRGALLPGRNVLGDGTPATRDCAGHGTLVAGIIAGREISDSGFVGVAPEAKILPVKTLENTDPQPGAERLIARGIAAAVDAGADVINVSAASFTDAPELRAAVNRALARDIVVVAAAGNAAQQSNALLYPAAYEGVLAVGAVKEDGTRADFSEVGKNVAVAAPGDAIVGPAPVGSGYLLGKGTSFSAPYVSGVAALIRAYYPQMKAKDVVERIKFTADRPGIGTNSEVGHGVVNPYRAVTALLTEPARAAPRREALPPRDDYTDPLGTTKTVALAVGSGLLVLLIVAMVAAAVLPRGRRRGWRPGRRQVVGD